MNISQTGTLLLAVWFGAVMGLAEAAHLAIRHLIERLPADGFSWALVWMGPISSALAFGLLGIALLIIGRLLDRWKSAWSPVSLPVAVLVFGFISFYGLLQDSNLHLATYAVILLSLGLAAALSRASRSRSEGFISIVRRTAPAVALVLLGGLAIGLWTMPRRVEARRLAHLPEPRSELPNVLLIILDTARAKNMSVYGYEKPTTPNLESFAARGATFDRAIATSSWTLPSHGSMFTGRLPFEMSGDIEIPLDDTYPTLAEVLSSRGYATAGFAANYFFTTRASGLSRGFARYEGLPIDWHVFISSSWISRRLSRLLGYRHPSDRLLGYRSERWALKHAETNTDDFLEWMATRPDRPFFVFLNYFDPHEQYYSPPPFRRMFAPPGLSTEWEPNTRLVTEVEMAGMRAAYDGSIAYTDHHLGRMFDTLEAAGVLDNTIVIVASDHGELFGEHGLRGHHTNLYMPVLHVPLIIVYPKAVPSGARISRPVSIRDIPATILELIDGRPDSSFPGMSLSRFWSTADTTGVAADGVAADGVAADGVTADGAMAPEPLYAETNYWPDAGIHDWEPLSRGNMKSLVIGDMYYIRNGDGVEELYDLSLDPAEERNLAPDPAVSAILEQARASLDSILAPRSRRESP